jgi:hypothetical protein
MIFACVINGDVAEGQKTPTYFLPTASLSSYEKKESSKLLTCGGNILLSLAYKFLICVSALLIVAVDPIIFA